ncbi:MAG: sulfite exporter TauE/SafE family protein, partial [Rhodospirillales bacterium]|nr:sulfite exporter TauE/SafE family protein [Rhodospirillales bacterium]
MTEFLAQVLTAEFALGALIVLFSGMIHGYTGFGAGLLMMPLFALLFGPIEAIAISTIVAIFGSAQLYSGAARHANWRELMPILIALVLATPMGTYLLFNLNPELIRRAMGGFVLLFALILMSGWIYRGHRSLATSAAAGAVSGLVTGAVGVGGPPVALYFLS